MTNNKNNKSSEVGAPSNGIKLLTFVFTFSFLVFNLVAAPAVFAQSESKFKTDLDSGLFDLEKADPLKTTNVFELLNRILRSLTLVAVPIAVLMIIIGAFQMMSAGGDPEKFSKGKKTILYAAIGFAVFLAARLLIGISAEILGAKPEVIEEIRRVTQ